MRVALGLDTGLPSSPHLHPVDAADLAVAFAQIDNPADDFAIEWADLKARSGGWVHPILHYFIQFCRRPDVRSET